MKKLAIGVLVVWAAAACRRQAVVTSAPPNAAPAASNATGGATANEALLKFLAAIKVQDLQAVSNVWGTKDGPAATDRRYMTVEMMEQRIIIMTRCFRHDSWSIRNETPLVGGDRQFTVELKYRTLTVSRDFTATPGPQSRWYISNIQMEPASPICSAR